MTIASEYRVEIGASWDADALRRLVGESERVMLTAHMNADGDAVGSVTGLYDILSAATGCRLTMMLPDGCPDDYRWLPHTEHILSGQGQPAECEKAIAEADLIVCLDLADLSRTGRLADRLRAAGCQKLLIDHHEHSEIKVQNREFDSEVVAPEISSACDLVYWLMRDLYGPAAFSTAAATSLYTGICTDTGTFSYTNRAASLYLAAADLVQRGIDPMEINRRIKNVFTPERLRFFGHAMNELLDVYPLQGVALMTIREEEMRRYGVSSAELTGLVNEVMKLKDTDCAILMREEGDKVRLSLRSKTRHDVNALARDLFGGGGHERAAGATSHLSLADTLAKVKRHLGLTLLALALALPLGSCRETPIVELQPQQRPDIKESLIDANRHISRSEETQIDSYLSRRGWEMQRLPSGVRFRRTEAGGGSAIGYEDTVQVTYSVHDLGGRTLYAARRDTLVAGKLQPTRGLDDAIRALRHGDRATVVVPSEQGYGVPGDGQRIGSRTVLIYDLKIE